MTAAPAVVIERMQVSRDDTRYTVAAAMTLDVPQRTAFRAATDYERLPEFNPSIVSSKRLSGRRLRSNIRLCVAFFCNSPTVLGMITYVLATYWTELR